MAQNNQAIPKVSDRWGIGIYRWVPVRFCSGDDNMKWLRDFLPETWQAWLIVLGTAGIMFVLAYKVCTEWSCF